jgi:hypothetical protein
MLIIYSIVTNFIMLLHLTLLLVSIFQSNNGPVQFPTGYMAINAALLTTIVVPS